MAPTGVTDRAFQFKSKGLAITSAAVKKGHPTVLKFSWTYDPKKSPEYFAATLFNTKTKARVTLDDGVATRDHGKGNTGTFTIDIDYMKDKPGKYLLPFVLYDFDLNYEVIAKSKAFEVKKSDF